MENLKVEIIVKDEDGTVVAKKEVAIQPNNWGAAEEAFGKLERFVNKNH